MADKVTSIYLDGGTADVHLLKGFSFDLGKKLVLTKTGNKLDWAKYPSAGADIKITFTSNFKGTLGANHIFSGNGITLDTQKGIISAVSGAVADPRQNFIVTIECSGTDVPEGPHFLYIRFHIHNDIVHQWLTPLPLTVRRGMVDPTKPETTKMKLSVYAQFDDGVMGDVTNYMFNQHAPNVPDPNSIKWTPSTHIVDIESGEIKVPGGSVVGGEQEIVATLPAALKGKVAKGKIKFAREWSSTNKNTARLVQYSAGYDKRKLVPNVLCLAEGFSKDDEGYFNLLMPQLIKKIRTENLFHPFNVLVSSMNFWYCFTESGERGITTENEYYKATGDATNQTLNFVPPTRKPKPAQPLTLNEIKNWKLGDMLFYIGYPAPGQTDGPALKDSWSKSIVLDNTALLNQMLIDAIYDLPLKQEWLKLTDRKLLNLKDTFLGLSVGALPDANTDKVNKIEVIHTNPNKVDRTKLNQFIATLVDEKSNVLDGLWGVTAGVRDKDFDLVLLLVNTHYGRGFNGDGIFTVFTQIGLQTLDGYKVTRHTDPSAPATAIMWKSVPLPAPLHPFPFVNFQMLIHELAHSFALHDEYGDRLQGKDEDERKKEHYYEFPSKKNGVPDPDSRNPVRRYSNIQPGEELGASGAINGDKIKWRWHRIDNAGIVNGPVIDKGGGKFQIPLRTGMTEKFKKDQAVLLRLRVENVYRSDLLEVVSFDASKHHLDVKPAIANTPPKNLILFFGYYCDVESTVANKGISGIYRIDELPNGDFRIELMSNHQAYSIGEKIRLAHPFPSNIQRSEHAFISVPLKVLADQSADSIEVSAESGNVSIAEMGLFAPGSIVYKPMDAPSSVKSNTYRFAEMIAFNVRQAINSKKIPLTGDPPVYDRKDNQIIITDYMNILKFPFYWCTAKRHRIVGLFAGGVSYHTGIYHPSGHCMMRAYQNDASAAFCPVCQYILVDMIDPLKHGEVNSHIEKLYPE